MGRPASAHEGQAGGRQVEPLGRERRDRHVRRPRQVQEGRVENPSPRPAGEVGVKLLGAQVPSRGPSLEVADEGARLAAGDEQPVELKVLL